VAFCKEKGYKGTQQEYNTGGWAMEIEMFVPDHIDKRSISTFVGIIDSATCHEPRVSTMYGGDQIEFIVDFELSEYAVKLFIEDLLMLVWEAVDGS
jgi:hypothetical protein